jgi:RsiW-degrading membrane proteinase PrsW (M82 family)
MWLALLIAILILGFALLIRRFEENTRELKNTFWMIIGLFFILYIGATIFISYRLNVYSAESIPSAKTDGNIKIINNSFQPIDLTTNP